MSLKTSPAQSTNASEQVTQNLSQVLADTYVIYAKTQNFHWNVTDGRFHSLHELFEEQYKQLAEAVDEIAERIRMLGAKAPGSLREFLELTTLAESGNNLEANDMLRTLTQNREALVQQIKPKIAQAVKVGDEGTADLLIQQLRAHEKAAWMLRSHFFDEQE